MTMLAINNLKHGHTKRRRNRGVKTYGDLNTVVGEDQGRVGRSELGVRHCELF